jgi:hypothetical protein
MMSPPKPEIEGIGIVLVGSFNPMIFQPAWFAAENLIREEEEQAAKIELIHRQVAIFSLDWLHLQVTDEQFAATTAQSSFYEPLRDLVLGTFRLLRHTPIRMMGLNRECHFRMPSEEAWHAFGHRLTPKEPWAGILREPGMRSLTMEGLRPDNLKGYIRVRVEPSVRVHPGVFINVNDHYEMKDAAAGRGCDEIIDILDREWKSSLDRSAEIVSLLLESK